MQPKKVILKISGPEDPAARFELVMDVMDSPIAHKWFQLLREALSQHHCFLEKNFSFLGLVGSPRNLDFLCGQLKKFVQQINQFSQEGHWKKKHSIDLSLEADHLLRDPGESRRLLNELHHHFEILQGQEWELSKYFLDSTTPIKFAIRQVNHLCHEMEYLLKSHFQMKEAPQSCSAFTIVSLLTDEDLRLELTLEDYDQFKLPASFGDVILHYCQSGKTHLEAFLDGDEVIERKNISGLRYCSPDFVICWIPPLTDRPHTPEWPERFRAWLLQNDYDPEDKRLGIGQCRIGRIRVEQFPARELSQIHALLARHSNIERITLEWEGGSLTRHFPERWSNPDFEKIQQEMLYEE